MGVDWCWCWMGSANQQSKLINSLLLFHSLIERKREWWALALWLLLRLVGCFLFFHSASFISSSTINSSTKLSEIDWVDWKKLNLLNEKRAAGPHCAQSKTFSFLLARSPIPPSNKNQRFLIMAGRKALQIQSILNFSSH